MVAVMDLDGPCHGPDQECTHTVRDRKWCPDCSTAVNLTPEGVRVDHSRPHAWDNVSCTWRKLKEPVPRCEGSGGTFIWCDV